MYLQSVARRMSCIINDVHPRNPSKDQKSDVSPKGSFPRGVISPRSPRARESTGPSSHVSGLLREPSDTNNDNDNDDDYDADYTTY